MPLNDSTVDERSVKTSSTVEYFHFAPSAFATLATIRHEGRASRRGPLVQRSLWAPNLSRRLIEKPSSARSLSIVATAGRRRCTRPWKFVTVPDFSAYVDAERTTSATAVVSFSLEE